VSAHTLRTRQGDDKGRKSSHVPIAIRAQGDGRQWNGGEAESLTAILPAFSVPSLGHLPLLLAVRFPSTRGLEKENTK
jgi:hypothetical protein